MIFFTKQLVAAFSGLEKNTARSRGRAKESRHTGLAVAEDGKLIRLETLDFWTAYHIVCGLIDEHGSLRVVIEVSRVKANWHGPTAAHNVGRVCREAELLADGLELAGAQVERVHPPGKVDTAAFARITGWTGRTNEHQRDAGMLAITTTKDRK